VEEAAQQITVRVQTSPENIIEVALPSSATVFYLATEVNKALPAPSGLPILSLDGTQMETDAILNELGVTNGSLLTARIPMPPVGVIGAPLEASPNNLAETAAMSCVSSLAIDADVMGASASSPVNDASDSANKLTNALRESIKQLVSCKTSSPQVTELMRIAEEVEKMETGYQSLQQQMMQLKSTIREQCRLTSEQSRLTEKLMREANASNGDADMWPAHQPSSFGYPGDADPAAAYQAGAARALDLFSTLLSGSQASQAQAQEEDEGRSFMMKKGDADVSEAHRQAQFSRPPTSSITGSGVLSSDTMSKEDKDRQRRAHFEQMQKNAAERAREQEAADQKSRSREAMFNTPFAGAPKMLGKH